MPIEFCDNRMAGIILLITETETDIKTCLAHWFILIPVLQLQPPHLLKRPVKMWLYFKYHLCISLVKIQW